MPEQRNRQGLTENAAGQVMCPTCREHRLTMVWVVYTSPYESVTVNIQQSKVIHQTETDEARRRGVGQHLTLLWNCRNGHQFSTELDYRADDDEPGIGSAAVGTMWEEPE